LIGKIYGESDIHRCLQEEQYFIYDVGAQRQNGLYSLKLIGADTSSEILANLSLEMYLKGEWLPVFYGPEELDKKFI
jgi:hypothetical protein